MFEIAIVLIVKGARPGSELQLYRQWLLIHMLISIFNAHSQSRSRWKPYHIIQPALVRLIAIGFLQEWDSGRCGKSNPRL